MGKRRQWVCGTIDVPGGRRIGEARKRGVAAHDKCWPRGSQLRIRFLGGSAALQERVLTTARAWLVPGLQLDLLPARAADAGDMRIAFRKDDGSWSYVGTDCRTIAQDEPTMNLGWATLRTPEDDFASVVIHEFGHALGLLHEHNHPEADIAWNKRAVYDELQGPPNHWSRKAVDDNVFARFAAADAVTEFDAVSVMIYTVPAHWTTDGTSFMPSPRLSARDAETILKLYG